ncbi:MAG TPA: mechanosensitive ion channel family protein [Anaerolineae bacterium]|nr:mechanosensitive ion channel family protein [Anaerolineae bacterium]HMR63127.1 mechanosensitive ion channel family protein [Anaerolineae bacterium]
MAELFSGIEILLEYYLNSNLQTKLVESLLIVVSLSLLRWLVIKVVEQRTNDVRILHSWRKVSSYFTAFICLVLLGRLWVSNLQALATFLGLLSAGIAIALQGPLTDIAGWLLILTRRPFAIGDRIEIGQHAGDVVDIRLFQFSLLEIGNWVHADQSTGRVLHVPNRAIFNQPLANYNRGLGYIWHEIEVFITFESNWEKAKSILQDIAAKDAAHLSPDAAERVREAARRLVIYYPHLTPIVYLRADRSGVMLTLRYLCDPRKRRSTEQAIWEDILKVFAQHPDLEFAYPTQRFYTRPNEVRTSQSQKTLPEDGFSPATEGLAPVKRKY